MSGFKLQRLGMIMEPDPGNPQEVDGFLISSLPSGFPASNAEVLFTTSAGTLSNGTASGSSVIATTNSSGVASVSLTLPAAAGPVTVTAQDQFALGGASVTFT
jgi:hypothetical protein